MATPRTTAVGEERAVPQNVFGNSELESSSQVLTLRQPSCRESRHFLHWPSVLVTALAASLISPIYQLATRPFSSLAPEPIDATDYLGRARQILKTTPLIDGHNDLPYLLRVELQNQIYDRVNLSETLLGHTDLGRMQKGQMGGQFWSVWVDCEPAPYAEDPTVKAGALRSFIHVF